MWWSGGVGLPAGMRCIQSVAPRDDGLPPDAGHLKKVVGDRCLRGHATSDTQVVAKRTRKSRKLLDVPIMGMLTLQLLSTRHSRNNVKSSLATFRRLVAWTWLAALLLTGSAAAAYVCPADMANGNVASMLQIGCADGDQPALCANYLRGSPSSAPQPHPPVTGDAPRPTSGPFWRTAAVAGQERLLPQRTVPSTSPVPIYLATARLRP